LYLFHVKVERMNTLIQLALDEDAVFNDLITQATIAADAQGSARIVAKSDGILSGISVAQAVFSAVVNTINCDWVKHDGDHNCCR